MAYIHQHQGRFVSFQSAWRWGGVGLLITASSPATAGPLFRFNPLGGGAGSGDSPPSGPQKRARFVSIPSEVGRGRSGLCPRPPHNVRVSFQSPRRWGGVGLAHPAHAEGHGTNDLEIVSIPSEVGRGRARASEVHHRWPSVSFQSPRRWGGGGNGKRYHEHWLHNVSFQSPRRWGGVGLSLFANACRPTLISFQSPRRWGGGGKAVAMDMSPAQQGFVSIPSEVGRGRVVAFRQRMQTDLGFVSIPSEVGRGRQGGRDGHVSGLARFRFNPLGGGAGSGKSLDQHRAAPHLRFVSIPSEVGRGRPCNTSSPMPAGPWFRFNPLGGGAGSGCSIRLALPN